MNHSSVDRMIHDMLQKVQKLYDRDPDIGHFLNLAVYLRYISARLRYDVKLEFESRMRG